MLSVHFGSTVGCGMSHNSVTDSTFRELETQIFIAEFTAVDAVRPVITG